MEDPAAPETPPVNPPPEPPPKPDVEGELRRQLTETVARSKQYQEALRDTRRAAILERTPAVKALPFAEDSDLVVQALGKLVQFDDMDQPYVVDTQGRRPLDENGDPLPPIKALEKVLETHPKREVWKPRPVTRVGSGSGDRQPEASSRLTASSTNKERADFLEKHGAKAYNDALALIRKQQRAKG